MDSVKIGKDSKLEPAGIEAFSLTAMPSRHYSIRADRSGAPLVYSPDCLHRVSYSRIKPEELIRFGVSLTGIDSSASVSAADFKLQVETPDKIILVERGRVGVHFHFLPEQDRLQLILTKASAAPVEPFVDLNGWVRRPPSGGRKAEIAAYEFAPLAAA